MFLFTPGGAVGVPCLSPLIDQVQLFHDLLARRPKSRVLRAFPWRTMDVG